MTGSDAAGRLAEVAARLRATGDVLLRLARRRPDDLDGLAAAAFRDRAERVAAQAGSASVAVTALATGLTSLGEELARSHALRVRATAVAGEEARRLEHEAAGVERRARGAWDAALARFDSAHGPGGAGEPDRLPPSRGGPAPCPVPPAPSQPVGSTGSPASRRRARSATAWGSVRSS